MRLLMAFFLSFGIYSTSNAHSGDGVAMDLAGRVGSGKAVEAFDAEQGFKLSQKAEDALEISFQYLSGIGTWQVPKEAIIYLKQSSAVYRRHDGWISMVLVKVVQANESIAQIQSVDLGPGDEVAIKGASFLRMTDADLHADTVDSCSH